MNELSEGDIFHGSLSNNHNHLLCDRSWGAEHFVLEILQLGRREVVLVPKHNPTESRGNPVVVQLVACGLRLILDKQVVVRHTVESTHQESDHIVLEGDPVCSHLIHDKDHLNEDVHEPYHDHSSQELVSVSIDNRK